MERETLKSIGMGSAGLIDRRVIGFDKTLASEQCALLEAAYGQTEEANLFPAIEHLSKAFFRGHAHIRPLYTPGGMLTSLTGATGIGHGATQAHEETWRTIVRRDAVAIATVNDRARTAGVTANGEWRIECARFCCARRVRA